LGGTGSSADSTAAREGRDRGGGRGERAEDTPRQIRRRGGPTEALHHGPLAACPTTIVKTFTVLIIMGNSR